VQTFQEYQEQQAYDALTPAELQEASLSRVMRHTENRPISIITAWRNKTSRKDNDSQNRKLMKDIRAMGFGAIKLQGKYIQDFGTPDAATGDGFEISFVVVGNEGDTSGNMLGFAKKMGKKYGQDSVLVKPAGADEDAILVGTNAAKWPGLGKIEKLGKWHPNRTPEFYSKMRGGTFAFESFEYRAMKSPSQRRERLF
tara:strand:- start:412 stop:1005 length:594 start_codon:yes stop_codon:yes gene_type:complete